MLVSSSQFSRRGHSNIGCVIHAAALVATVAALVGALLGRPADAFWLHDRMLERVLESASNDEARCGNANHNGRLSIAQKRLSKHRRYEIVEK